MKFSTQEEYGLRCMLRIAKSNSSSGLTIPEIAQLEGLSQAHTAKLLRILRLGGFIESSRGQSGGYKLSKEPEEIIIGDVLRTLGGKLFESTFCNDHSGVEQICTHSIDCSIRSLWRAVQTAVDSVLNKTTLKNLLSSEQSVNGYVSSLLDELTLEESNS